MPVQFYCPKCRQLLSVGMRKVGEQVACPKCRRPVVVPTPEAAAASLAMVRGAREAPPAVPLPEFAVYDEDAEPFPAIQMAPPAAPGVSDPPAPPPKTSRPPAPQSAPAQAPNAEKQTPPITWTTEGGTRPMLLVSRGVLYFQAVLFLLVAVVAFGVGYLTGYGTAPEGGVAGKHEVQPVELQGRLLHATAGGENRGDAGAVILVLPEDRQPEPKLPIAGLRPEDPRPAEGAQVMLALEELGAAYQRAAADGSYSLSVPAPGKYFVCFISRNTSRAADTPPLDFELALLNRYFDQAEQLIGQHKYRFRREEFQAGPVTRSHNFEK